MRVPQIQPPRVGEQRLAYVQGLIDESMGLITAQDIFNSCQLQSLVDEIGQWCTDNDMQLNHSKCKELIISSAKNKPQLHPLLLQDYNVSAVLSTKIWGIHLSSDLRWKLHIEHTVAKASKRLYFLRVLKRSGVDQSSLIKVYATCLRPVLEYGCQIWNYNSPHYLKEEIERTQRQALQIMSPPVI